jgi:hypothetical protein
VDGMSSSDSGDLPVPDERVWREMLGSYALGHLSDEERQEVEARLVTSMRLRADLDEIRPVVVALPRTGRTVTATLEAPPPDLEDRIFARIASERGTQTSDLDRARAKRQLRRTGIAATAVAAAAAVIFAVAIVRDDDGPSGTSRPTKLVQLAAATSDVPATGSGTLIGFAWGTQIRMTISGLEPGQRYRVYLEGPNGERIDAGTFQALPDRPVVCEMSGDLLLAETGRLVIAEASDDIDGPGAVVATADVVSAPTGTTRQPA